MSKNYTPPKGPAGQNGAPRIKKPIRRLTHKQFYRLTRTLEADREAIQNRITQHNASLAMLAAEHDVATITYKRAALYAGIVFRARKPPTKKKPAGVRLRGLRAGTTQRGGGAVSGDQFRDTRLALGMTQAQLAARLGVAPEAVAQWESGQIAVTPEAELAILQLARRKRKPKRVKP